MVIALQIWFQCNPESGSRSVQDHPLIVGAYAENGARLLRVEAVNVVQKDDSPVRCWQFVDLPQDESAQFVRKHMTLRTTLFIRERMGPVAGPLMAMWEKVVWANPWRVFLVDADIVR
jgi:hypothetical protein